MSVEEDDEDGGRWEVDGRNGWDIGAGVG